MTMTYKHVYIIKPAFSYAKLELATSFYMRPAHFRLLFIASIWIWQMDHFLLKKIALTKISIKV